VARENQQIDDVRARMRENAPLCVRDKVRHQQCAPFSTVRQGGKKSLSDAKILLEVGALKVRLASVESRLSATSTVVPIQSLHPSGIVVQRPILASVYLDDGCYVASFVDANINGSGESILEAVEMLKEQISWTFSYYTENEGSLGEATAKQLAVLKEFLASA